MIAARQIAFGKAAGGVDYGDATVIKCAVTADDLTFAFSRYTERGYSVSGLYGHSEFTVDWGDGTVDTYTGLKHRNDNSSIYPQHTYAEPGEYTVVISNDLECFNFCNNLKVTGLIQWGKDVTYGCHFSYRSAYYNMSTFYGCENMVGNIPPFPQSMVDALGTFGGCTGLTGNIPEWNDALTNAGYCYIGCRGLTGNIPEWNDAIIDAGYCYGGCTGLIGNIPEWNDVMTNAACCYRDCEGLTGNIPEWNDAITNAEFCCYGCTGLTGNIPEWNDAITNASYCYYGCSGLSGNIPKWNDAITNASYCYRYCTGLSGIWDESATDEEIHPSHITSYANCVSNTSATLKQYFYTTWGGTKAVPSE